MTVGINSNGLFFMKKYIFALAFTVLGSIAEAQYGLVSQYHFNYLAINPALAGSNGPFSVRGVLGNQFNGTITPNQVSQVVVIDGELYNKSGIAFQGFRNNIGNILSQGLGLSYSKGFELGNDFEIRVGANSGILVQPNISQFFTSRQVAAPYLGLGTFMHFKGAFLGVSQPIFYGSKKITETKPLYFNAGYIFNTESAISFNANTLVSYDINSKLTGLDFNFKTWISNRLGVGFSYRDNKLLSQGKASFLPIIEYNFSESFKVGLCYIDAPSRNFNTVPNNTINQLPINGIFQLMFRYSNSPSGKEFLF